MTKNMEEENINISFTDFESVSINTMKELWKDEDFTDVTLATSDGKRQLKAHRIVLSSASSVFHKIFLQHKHYNPLIFLHGIHLGMMEQILEFIYTGRCEIHQDDLKMFLNCGTALGIQRLAGCVESKDKAENTFNVETKKTVFESDPHVNTGTILAIEKGVVEDNSENMEHSQMNIVDLEQALGSKDEINELNRCVDEDTNVQIGIVDMTKIKTTGCEDKTLSVPNHSSGNKPERVITPCKFCDETFISRNSLRMHLRKHQKVTPRQRAKKFSCTICDYETRRPCQLRDHEDMHGGKVFKCNKCDSLAKSRESLKSHIKTMHGVPLSCTQCEFKSPFRLSMKNHMETMHEDNTYKCDQCVFDTKTQKALRKHKTRVHSEVTRKKCKMCNYSSKHSLKWHQRSVHEGLKLKCDKCDKTVNNPDSLKVHERAHHRQKVEYSCNECEFTTTGQKVQLFQHAERAHGTKEHFCEKCPYKTKAESNLKIHINREHLKLYHFQCEHCSYSSKQKTHLDIHTKSKHEGESLMCNLCNYKASQSSNLKRHENTKHRQATGEKAISPAQSTED